jgi:hypothetical protein
MVSKSLAISFLVLETSFYAFVLLSGLASKGGMFSEP